MTKQRIIGLVLVVLLLSGLGYKYYEYTHPETIAQLEQVAETKK